MGSNAERQEKDKVRAEVELVLKRYRRTLLVSTEKCEENAPAILDISRDLTQLDSFQEEFRKVVAGDELTALVQFKREFFGFVFNRDSEFPLNFDLFLSQMVESELKIERRT